MNELQEDSDGDGEGDMCESICLRDLTNDGIINPDDIVIVNDNLDRSQCNMRIADGDSAAWCNMADVDRDGDVDYDDVLKVGRTFGVSCSCSENEEVCDGLDSDCDGDVPSSELDSDGDYWPKCFDNCYMISNEEQSDGNGNGVGDACELKGCIGDTNLKGDVNIIDVSKVKSKIGRTDCGSVIGDGETKPWCDLTDVDRDGDVDDTDMSLVKINMIGACVCEDTPEICDNWDNNCNGLVDEGCWVEPPQPPQPPGPGNGGNNGGGTFITQNCSSNWTCTDWSGCENGVKYRDCVDAKNCSVNATKPSEVESCEEIVELGCSSSDDCALNESCLEGVCVTVSDDSDGEGEFARSALFWVGSTAGVIIICLLVVYLIMKMGKEKTKGKKKREFPGGNRRLIEEDVKKFDSV